MRAVSNFRRRSNARHNRGMDGRGIYADKKIFGGALRLDRQAVVPRVYFRDAERKISLRRFLSRDNGRRVGGDYFLS